jgi:hypothetical protein
VGACLLCKGEGDRRFSSFSLRVDLRSCDCQGGSNSFCDSFWGNNEIPVVDEVAVAVVVAEKEEEEVEKEVAAVVA